jgi:polysaccharide deacetylase family protein (PEP-CTERM system associated)
VFMLTPEAFRDDIRRSVDVIVSQTGTGPKGYRAPGFSIDHRCLWAGPILAECGLAYSSSIFPIRGRRYGMPDAPRWPHRWDGCDLWEFPLTTVKLLGKNLPMCGGGYFRLLPWPILSLALSRVNRQGHPAVIYMHPYELDVHEAVDLTKQGHVIPTKTRFMQSLFRSRINARLERLFQQYRFAPMAEVLGIARPADPLPA